ncbi:MAG: hypothetical protein V1875_04745 [Candidatus Altiarchaeota archaeon]
MFKSLNGIGLGPCYMGFISFLNGKPDVLRKAGVPEGYELMVPFSRGIPKAMQGAGRRSKPDVIGWI